MKSGIYFGFVLTTLCFGASWGQNKNFQEAHKRFFETLGKVDSRIRPPGTNTTEGPVIVKTQVYIRSIMKVDDMNQEFNVRLTVRSKWIDTRLAFADDIKFINLNELNAVWTPDVFFSNEKDGKFHDLLRPNVLIRIYPKGEVLYIIRISMRLSCPMNFRHYPHDVQKCSLVIPIYGHTTEELVLLWNEVDPVQVSVLDNLTQFKLTNVCTQYCASKTATGEYSCIKAEFLLQRSSTNFFNRVYIPSIMIILASYLQLWMSVTAISGRIFLAFGSLLAMAAGCVDLSHSIPQTDYTKAIDVWTGVCMSFLFWSLSEFVLVHYLAKRNSESGSGEATEFEKKLCAKRLMSHFSNLSLPERIDVITRAAYPSLFVLFTVIYFSVYHQENVEDNSM